MPILTIRFPKGRLYYLNGNYDEPGGRIPAAITVEDGCTLIETLNGNRQIDYKYDHCGATDTDVRLVRVVPPESIL